MPRTAVGLLARGVLVAPCAVFPLLALSWTKRLAYTGRDTPARFSSCESACENTERGAAYDKRPTSGMAGREKFRCNGSEAAQGEDRWDVT
jgi:hypothetical protein